MGHWTALIHNENYLFGERKRANMHKIEKLLYLTLVTFTDIDIFISFSLLAH